jgi:hypothetical protein
MRLNHRGWARLAARPEKCQRRRRKNKAKAGLERHPGRSWAMKFPQKWLKRGGGGVCTVRFPEPFQKTGFD